MNLNLETIKAALHEIETNADEYRYDPGQVATTDGVSLSAWALYNLQAATLKSRNARDACVHPDHRHETYHLVDGTNVDEPVAMTCWGEDAKGWPCARPAHLHVPSGRYCHNDPATPDCDYAGPPVTECTGRL
jgi:hypothetical protein